MLLELDIKLKDNYVEVKILHQDPSITAKVYNEDVSVYRDSGFFITSCDCPQITYNGLFIKGRENQYGEGTFFSFKTSKDAEAYVNNLYKALRVINRKKLVYGKY